MIMVTPKLRANDNDNVPLDIIEETPLKDSSLLEDSAKDKEAVELV